MAAHSNTHRRNSAQPARSLTFCDGRDLELGLGRKQVMFGGDMPGLGIYVCLRHEDVYPLKSSR